MILGTSVETVQIGLFLIMIQKKTNQVQENSATSVKQSAQMELVVKPRYNKTTSTATLVVLFYYLSLLFSNILTNFFIFSSGT